MNALKCLTEKGLTVRASGKKVKLSGLSSLPSTEREQILKLASQRKEELLLELSILEWGEHAPLVRWFIENKLTLPTESFCLWRDGKCSLWWMHPVAMYQQLFHGILEGPDFEYADELVSILNQLKAKFGKG